MLDTYCKVRNSQNIKDGCFFVDEKIKWGKNENVELTYIYAGPAYVCVYVYSFTNIFNGKDQRKRNNYVSIFNTSFYFR